MLFLILSRIGFELCILINIKYKRMNPITTWIAFIGITLSACSQDISASKVPSVVTNALQSKFSTATNVDWEKKKNFYEAEFKQDSLEYTVEIDASGKIIRSKAELTQQQLPAPVSSAITSQYKDYKIDDVEKLEMNGDTFYQVELDGAGTKKDVKLVMDANGSTRKTTFWD